MHRQPLIEMLTTYRGVDAHEEAMCSDMLQFVQTEPMCFERSLLKGHMTASAWILDSTRKKVVLLLHKKLGLWLQPGGHADGNPDLLGVAMQETLEETGLEVKPILRGIFDVDIHTIPARKDVPEHLHFDVRFLLEAPQSASLTINHESRNLAWIPLQEVPGHNPDRSIVRLVEKSNQLFS
jgi:8-oxo-dGTP pyrophosphatase MutT (NUDIX family)